MSVHSGGQYVAGRITLNGLSAQSETYVRIPVHGIMEQGCSRVSLVLSAETMVNRNSRGHSYRGARGEIRGPSRDALKRRHLPRVFSLIKNESQRFEGD